MKLILVGHRGVGKTSLLKRIQKYIGHFGYSFHCLDEEIERVKSKKIKSIFSEEGEAVFRQYEQEVFTQLSEEVHGENIIVAVGAGFKGELPLGWQVLWVRRAISSQDSVFLDRPNLDAGLGISFKKYEEREKFYSKLCDFEIELLEHKSNHCSSEEKYFKNLFGLERLEVSDYWNMTLYSKHLKKIEFFKLLGVRFELRDDILNYNQINQVRSFSEDSILSLRDPHQKDKSLKLAQTFQTWDWPFEWGKENAPILSLHKRKTSLIETLKSFEREGSLLKLAVPIENFTELKAGWDWHKQDPKNRVFLPSSKSGRWSDFRLLTAEKMPWSFLRQGEGSSPDQPTLFKILNFKNEFKNFASILGSPVKQSLTPSTHNVFFENKKANVLGFDVKKEELGEALPFLKNMGLNWAAVTSPLKNKAHDLIHEKSKNKWGAVNTIALKNGEWQGANTDGFGFEVLVQKLKNQSVAVWGGGGTLEMIRSFLPDAHYYSSRTGLIKKGDSEVLPEAIVWAVGKGHFSQEGVMPPAHWQPKQVVDLNYTQDSPGILCAHNYGCQYRSGLDMFFGQAKAQQEFWKNYE